MSETAAQTTDRASDPATDEATDQTDLEANTDPDASGGPVADIESLAPAVEALLLSADKPMTPARLAECLAEAAGDVGDGPEAESVRAAIETLNTAYEQTGRSFRIEQVAGGYRVMTLPEHAEAVAALHRMRAPSKLSRAALETLAIVAYRQPITRAELEAIRGVACGEVLRSLMERRLITITGRAEELGRPMLYGTTKQFLDSFGLGSLKDLPPVGEDGPSL